MTISEWINIGLGVFIPVVTLLAGLWAKTMRAEIKLIKTALEGKLKLVQSKQSAYAKNQTTIWRKLQKHSDKLADVSEGVVQIKERIRAIGTKSHPEMDSADGL